MKAAQTIYLTADRKRAVPEGHKEAQSLLVREGGEITEEQAKLYEGATELAGGTKKAAPADKGTVHHRDPKTK